MAILSTTGQSIIDKYINRKCDKLDIQLKGQKALHQAFKDMYYTAAITSISMYVRTYRYKNVKAVGVRMVA